MPAKGGKGLDIGTVNLVSAVQDDKANVLVKKMRNAFIDVPMDNFSKNMLTRLKVPYVVQGKKMYVLGDAASSWPTSSTATPGGRWRTG